MNTKDGGKSVELIISCGDVPYDTLKKLKERFYDAPIYAVHGNHCPSAAFPHPIVGLHLNVVKKGALLISGFEGILVRVERVVKLEDWGCVSIL
jgi:hypothetical protein